MKLGHALLTTDVVGGVWDFSLVLARELRSRKAAHVTLLVLGRPSPTQVQEAAAADVQLIVEPLKLEWMQASEADVVRTRELVGRVARELRADVVHANQFAAACADVEVPVVLTLHSDVLSWRSWTLGTTDVPPEWSAYATLVGEALARATTVVAVSSFLADAVRAVYEPRRDIRVIHNGWPSEVLPAAADRGRVTLVAGRVWDPAKNVGLVSHAAQGWSPGTVYLAGEQADPEFGRCAAVPQPLQALGFVYRSRLDALFSAALVYLSAARYDPFGLLPLQAALNGCCLLLSDIPSYRELWDGVAVFFRSGDAVDLRTQWSRLLDDPERARDLASRALRRARERYAVERMADAYLDLYGLRSAAAA